MMPTFSSPLEAKEFFIARIVAAARREKVTFSDLERQNLYFTESGSDAKPEYMKQAAEFEAKYDNNKYEEKVRDLLRKAYAYDTKHQAEVYATDARELYRNAYGVLRREDHYILVMIDAALGGRLRKKFLGLF